jgi:hypothetical protein
MSFWDRALCKEVRSRGAWCARAGGGKGQPGGGPASVWYACDGLKGPLHAPPCPPSPPDHLHSQAAAPFCAAPCVSESRSGDSDVAAAPAPAQLHPQCQSQPRDHDMLTATATVVAAAAKLVDGLHQPAAANPQQQKQEQQQERQQERQQPPQQHQQEVVDHEGKAAAGLRRRRRSSSSSSSTCSGCDDADASAGGARGGGVSGACPSASYSSICSSALGSMSMASMSSSMASIASSSLSLGSRCAAGCGIACALAGGEGSNCSTSSAWSGGALASGDDDDSCSTCGTSNSGCAWILSRFGGREVLADYEFGLPLGRGTFGVTRLVTERVSARPFACKTVCKERINSRQYVEDMRSEVQILQHLVGVPGVVQLRGAYEDCRAVNLVLELCAGGDLLDHILCSGRLPEDDAAAAARAIVLALQRCHARGVMHRDVKPENFLLAAAGCAASCRVSDFGVSALFSPGQKFREVVGTPYYMAPEVLLRCYDQVG